MTSFTINHFLRMNPLLYGRQTRKLNVLRKLRHSHSNGTILGFFQLATTQTRCIITIIISVLIIGGCYLVITHCVIAFMERSRINHVVYSFFFAVTAVTACVQLALLLFLLLLVLLFVLHFFFLLLLLLLFFVLFRNGKSTLRSNKRSTHYPA